MRMNLAQQEMNFVPNSRSGTVPKLVCRRVNDNDMRYCVFVADFRGILAAEQSVNVDGSRHIDAKSHDSAPEHRFLVRETDLTNEK